MNARTLLLIIVIIIIGGLWWYYQYPSTFGACTMEAKICPDGSTVGRTGPQCEFAACPTATTTNTVDMGTQYTDWKQVVATSTGVSFSYPETFNMSFVHPVDWPPQIRIENTAFTCTEAGTSTARAGKTTREKVGTVEYCMTQEVEGAAGSVYTQYAYGFSKDATHTYYMTFSIRTPQCMNYDEPQQSSCKSEQGSFDPTRLADAIARTIER